MHTRKCALTRVLLWPERTPLKHTVAGRKAAVRLSKVVTRDITDWISGWKLKHTGVSETNFIGELNRRSTKKFPFKKPPLRSTASKQGSRICITKKAPLCPPTPGYVVWVPPKNFSQFFVKEFLDETRYRSAISAAH